jgi:S-adenosylmethionine hydrolase
MSNYSPKPSKPLEISEKVNDSITISIDGYEIAIWRSSLESDEGQPVVQIDGSGMIRVNVNDGPIWNADPQTHEHKMCRCVVEFEAREED